jgi:hypothetical protein
MSRVTLAEAKSWSSIYFSEKDAEVQLILDGVESTMRDFCDVDSLDELNVFGDSPQDSPASEQLDPAVKVAILQLFDDCWQNKGVTATGTIVTEGPIWQRIAHFKRKRLGV